MNDELKNFILGMGALAEAMAVFRNSLLKQGFTKLEALELTKVYLNNLTNQHKEDNNDG